MRALLSLVLGLAALPASGLAQPADCPAAPPTGETNPVWLDLGGLPGAPKGLSGQVGIAVPLAQPGAYDCAGEAPPLAGDVLRGDPGDLLRGDAAGDVLGGSPAAPTQAAASPD